MRHDYAWLNQVALTTLSRGYLREGIAPENLKDEAIARINGIVDRAEEILGFELPTLRQGIRRGWVSPASPIWSNFGAGRGLPISCNGSFMDDNMDSILFKNAEVGMMTKEGAGTSVYMGKLRAFGQPITGGGRSEGPTHFARLPQEQVTVVSQGNTRRGNAAVYLDIEHDDAERWLEMRSISGGVYHPIQHLSFGLVIGDDWMNAMLAEEKGGPKRKLMAKIRNKRRETGFPYLIFRDNANNARPEILKRLNLLIYASNLCTEVMLPSGPNESFVCDLSSVNLLYYNEWKGTRFVREMIYREDQRRSAAG
jgi:ribonucleoside-diphosphate reductase alpha chain